MANGLKLCPFCGKKVCIGYDEGFIIEHFDEKSNCIISYIQLYNIQSSEEAENEWNTRSDNIEY